MKPEIPHWERPLAAKGLTSYRYKNVRGTWHGWIMIGATDHNDALREAQRSLTASNEKALPEHLEIWNGNKYQPVC